MNFPDPLLINIIEVQFDLLAHVDFYVLSEFIQTLESNLPCSNDVVFERYDACFMGWTIQVDILHRQYVVMSIFELFISDGCT